MSQTLPEVGMAWDPVEADTNMSHWAMPDSTLLTGSADTAASLADDFGKPGCREPQ